MLVVEVYEIPFIVPIEVKSIKSGENENVKKNTKLQTKEKSYEIMILFYSFF
jgi:hypothetical protein